MSEEQKEFLVIKIEKYNEERDKLKDEIKGRLFVAGLCTLLLFLSIKATGSYSTLDYEELAPDIALAGSGLFLIGYYANLIKCFMKKIGLSHRIDEINQIIQKFEQTDNRKGKTK